MKKAIYILFLCFSVAMSFATYTYTIKEYQTLPDLEDNETIFVTDQGGGGLINLFDNSSMILEDTSTLEEGVGGIWTIELMNSSSLYMSGGEVHMIDIGDYATAYLSGGLIQQIWSGQYTGTFGPHITIECLDHYYSDNTKLLTGHWMDNTAFSIYLIDVPNYSPAIQNITFIPEPATLMLLGLGGLLLRRK
jgi:hypothetical protein